MTRELALTLLRAGATGEQMLQILETITNEDASDLDASDFIIEDLDA